MIGDNYEMMLPVGLEPTTSDTQNQALSNWARMDLLAKKQR
jgi:hypothetical protein